MTRRSIASYAEFWPYYLREHSRPATRAWHYFGTSLVLALLAAAAVLRNPWLLAVAVIAGYAPAWIGHFGIEKNHPATFRHPLWSLASDFRMYGAWLSGRIGGELERAGVAGGGRQG